MGADPGLLGLTETLDLFPQKEPFLFVDRLTEVSLGHAVGTYRFKPDEYYFRGHFPGLPVVPGVIMLEMICQIGQAVFIQHLWKEGRLGNEGRPAPGKRLVGYFTDAKLEIFGKLLPGEQATGRAEQQLWRMNRVKTRGEIRNEAGVVVAEASYGAMVVLEDR